MLKNADHWIERTFMRIFSPVWSDLQGSDFVREEIDSVEKAIEKVDAKHKVQINLIHFFHVTC